MTRNILALARFSVKSGYLSKAPRKNLASIPRLYALYIGGPRPGVELVFFFWVHVVFLLTRPLAVLLRVIDSKNKGLTND